MSQPEARATIPAPSTEEETADFDTFFERQRDPLFRRMWLVTGDRAEADDVVQEAFLRLLGRWDRVHVLEDPEGYLYRTAFNVLRSRIRRAKLAVRKAVGSASQGANDFEAAEARHVVARAMRGLTERQRSVLVLVELLGYSANDAAEVLGIRPSTVRSTATQARAAMRATLGGEAWET
jgi:RNA polymerase sigma factor (sigma-70 family)